MAVAAASCGGRTAAPPSASAPLWRVNTVEVIRQLRGDVAAAELGGDTPRSAGRALARTSDLYALLIAYSDLGGCRAMVAGAQAPQRVAAPLEGACAHLQRAAALFARATQHDDARALVRATREARLASPELVSAAAAVRSTASATSRGRPARGTGPAR